MKRQKINDYRSLNYGGGWLIFWWSGLIITNRREGNNYLSLPSTYHFLGGGGKGHMSFREALTLDKVAYGQSYMSW